MSRGALRFWGSALVVAILFTAAAAVLFPYESLRLVTAADRQRAWFLSLWTAGVMAILFGISGLLAFGAPLGIREVQEAGGVRQAIELRRQARVRQEGGYGNFAWWLVATGVLLIFAYFAAWGLGINVEP